MVVSQEYTWVHARRHIALSIMLWAFRRLLVEDILAESYQALPEIATAESLPSCLAVFSYLHGVENKADMFQQPRR